MAGPLRRIQGRQETYYSIDGDRLEPESPLEVELAPATWVRGRFEWDGDWDRPPFFTCQLQGADGPLPMTVALPEGCTVRRPETPGEESGGVLTEDQVRALRIASRRMQKDAEKQYWAVNGYEIYGKLGEGGLGVVLKAKQRGMNRIVALKILHKRWVGDEEFRKRFLVEGRLVGKLSHPNLIKVFEVGRQEWKVYFSMEYVDGETVEDLVEREGPMEFLRALEITREMVGVIRYLSESDLVHCDIKPSNIMLDKNGHAKLSDFGFVKCSLKIFVEDESAVLGTPDFMSPEQALGSSDLDYRSDVYSLGASFYYMVTGRTPYDGSATQVMRKHVEGNLTPVHFRRPDTPDSIATVIERMMARTKERYPVLQRLEEDLEEAKADLLHGDSRRVRVAQLAAENEALRGRLRVVTFLLVLAGLLLMGIIVTYNIR